VLLAIAMAIAVAIRKTAGSVVHWRANQSGRAHGSINLNREKHERRIMGKD
jgi:hypothetical protein